MNTLKVYLDSLRQGQMENSVLFVQKGVADYVFRLLGGGSFGRKGFTNVGGNTLFQFKSPQDIQVASALFRKNNQYIITGSDVLRKGEVSGIFDDNVIEELTSNEVWGSPSTLSVFGAFQSLDMISRGVPPDIIYTRGTPTLTRLASDKAYPDADITISEVDGNTEAFVALKSQSPEKLIVCGTEFVQTGRSLQDTGSFILREDGIYEPYRGIDGDFILKQGGTSTTSQIFAQSLTTEVQVLFAKLIPELT